LKQTIAIGAGVLALALAAANPAAAQLVYPVPPPGAAVVMPPYEVVAIVRSTGLEPLSHPVRHGPAYVLRAADPAGQVMRVVVDARLGRIVRVVPVFGPRYAAPVGPPPYGRPPGAIALMPDGYSPNSRIAALPPPGLDGPPLHAPAGAYDGLPGARAPATHAPPQPSAQAGPPPLPRPRPNLASAGTSAAKPTPEAAPVAAPPAPAAAAPPAVEMHE
jgi:hypothetical protein